MDKIVTRVANYMKENTIWRFIADFVYISGSLIGSGLIASNTGLNVFGYCLFFVSSLAGVYLLRGTNASKSLLVVTLYYAAVNLIGIYRYM